MIFNFSKFGKKFSWYKIATKEELQNYFSQAVNSIQNSINKRKEKGIYADPKKILSQKVSKYKKLLRNEFNILLDRFSLDPDKDMQWFIDNYDQIPNFDTETVYRNPLLETGVDSGDKELFDFFASNLMDADPTIINWAIKKSKYHLDHYVEEEYKESELKEILNYIQTFIDTRDKFETRNINDIESFLHLKRMISGGTLQNKTIDPKEKERFEIEDPPSPEDIKFNGHFYELYHGTTLSDYAYLGKGTRWCFKCDKDNDPDLGVAMAYLAEGDIWVIFRDGNPFRAVNLLGEDANGPEYKDEKNNNAGIDELENKFPDFYEKIKESSINFGRYENQFGLFNLIFNGTITRDDDEFFDIIKDVVNESYPEYYDENIKKYILLNKIVIREDGDIFYSILSNCMEELEFDDIRELLDRKIIIPEDSEIFQKAIEKISDNEIDFLKNILKYGGIDRDDLFWDQLVDKIIDNSSPGTIESFISQGIIAPKDGDRFWKAINYLYEKIGDSERWYHFVTNVLYGKDILTEIDLANRGYQVPVEDMPFEVDDSEDLNAEIFGSKEFSWYKIATAEEIRAYNISKMKRISYEESEREKMREFHFENGVPRLLEIYRKNSFEKNIFVVGFLNPGEELSNVFELVIDGNDVIQDKIKEISDMPTEEEWRSYVAGLEPVNFRSLPDIAQVELLEDYEFLWDLANSDYFVSKDEYGNIQIDREDR